MTIREAQAIARENGYTLRKRDGEYRVNKTGGEEATAYYTDDLDDAIATVRFEAKREAAQVQNRWNAGLAMQDSPEGHPLPDEFMRGVIRRYNHHRTSELERRYVVLFGVIQEWKEEVSDTGPLALSIQDEVDELSAILNRRPDRSHPDLDFYSYLHTLRGYKIEIQRPTTKTWR